MNQITTADEFPTIIDAMRFYNAEIDRIAKLPASKEKNRELDYLEAFALSIASRIEHEKGGEVRCTIPISKVSSPICESSSCTGKMSQT
ncbi:hypothetical protein JQN58_05485 [Aneurinibacillus sp. BA2021]|nr:hypothetical protein [Aneurinibacillus sp. BA2021]